MYSWCKTSSFLPSSASSSYAAGIFWRWIWSHTSMFFSADLVISSYKRAPDGLAVLGVWYWHTNVQYSCLSVRWWPGRGHWFWFTCSSCEFGGFYRDSMCNYFSSASRVLAVGSPSLKSMLEGRDHRCLVQGLYLDISFSSIIKGCFCQLIPLEMQKVVHLLQTLDILLSQGKLVEDLGLAHFEYKAHLHVYFNEWIDDGLKLGIQAHADAQYNLTRFLEN